MKIQFACRHCGKKFNVSAEHAGRAMKCSRCDKKLKIPSAKEAATKRVRIKQTVPIEDDEEEFFSLSTVEDLELDEASSALNKRQSKRSRNSKAQLENKKAKGTPLSKKLKKSKGSSKQKTLKSESLKSKRKKSESEKSPINPKILYGSLLGSVSLVLIVGIGWVTGLLSYVLNGPKVEAPTEFGRYNETTIGLSMDFPAGWKPYSNGAVGLNLTKMGFKSGRNIEVHLRSTLILPTIGDLENGGFGALGAGSKKNAKFDTLEKVHEYHKERTALEIYGYKQGDEEPLEIETGLGEALATEFTSNRFYGYRFSIMTGGDRYNIVCTCRTKNEWDVYKPVFERMVKSLDWYRPDVE